MSDANKDGYGPAEEARLRAYVEQTVGGRVVRMERLVRWRPAWFVDVERDGEIVKLHLRGERAGEVMPFPELRREADILTVLEEHGVAVPHIYGVCPDPVAIVMAAIPGSRDMALAGGAAEKLALVREYLTHVVRMHKLPVDPFVARGLTLPANATEIGLAGLDAYYPLYLKTKKKPEPLVEFALAWVRRNVPLHRDQPRFIQLDSGQFLHHQGRVTGLYDFEFSLIGDPWNDLATMRMRDSIEPLGVDMRTMCKLYEEISGETVEHDVIRFHTVVFSMVSVMQFAGTMADPQPGDPHNVYLEWDLALRQVLLRALAASMGIEMRREPAPPAPPGPNAVLLNKLADLLAQLNATDERQAAQKAAANDMIEGLLRHDSLAAEMIRRNIEDAANILGRRIEDWAELETELEAFVRAAGPELDETLLRLFIEQEDRRMMIFGPTHIGASAMNVSLPPTE